MQTGHAGAKGYFSIHGGVAIGRNPDHQIVIDDPYVSQYHTRIEKRKNEYYLVDLKYKNYTYLNEKILQGEICLLFGDKIKIGMVTLKFER